MSGLDLPAGANRPLPDGALTVRVDGPFDVCLLITSDTRKVDGDEDFVFFNQPSAPGARILGNGAVIDPRRLRPGATRVTIAASPEAEGAVFGRLPAPVTTFLGRGGVEVARCAPAGLGTETVVLLAEVYRHGGAWKVRALGQGYASGLAGLARDFGVDVTEDAAPPQASPVRPPAPAPAPARPAPAPARPAPARPAPAPPRAPVPPPAPVPPRAPVPPPAPVPAGGWAPPRPATPPPGTVPPQPGPAAPAGAPAPPPGVLPAAARASSPTARIEISRVPPAGTLPVPRPAAAAAPVVLDGLNRFRAGAGAPPLTADPRLEAAAREHCAAMARHGLLAHDLPGDGSAHARAVAAGYRFLRVATQVTSWSRPVQPDVAIAHWIRHDDGSPGLAHADLRHAGVAYADLPGGPTYWTLLVAEPFTDQGLARDAAEVVRLTNAERTVAGLHPLTWDPRLAGAAQAHSEDMAARGFFDHRSPDGRQPHDRVRAAGYPYGSGENIAAGQATPLEAVVGWMNSPGHRENILRPQFRRIGVGFAGGGPHGTYWTQVFGTD